MTDQTWRRSSLCATANCVEVAYDGSTVHVRNSTDPDGVRLTFTIEEWVAFIRGVRAGDHKSSTD